MVEKSDLPCFQNIDLKAFVNRFQLGCTDKEVF
jgi:phosphatidylinositol 4-kinase